MVMRGKWAAVLALTAMLAGRGTNTARSTARTTGTAVATRAPAGSRAAATVRSFLVLHLPT